MTQLIRAGRLRIIGAIAGIALVAAFVIGVSPYPTEVLGQTPPPRTGITYNCEGGVLVVSFTIPLPGLPGGFTQVTRVPLGSEFLCRFIEQILEGPGFAAFGAQPASPAVGTGSA